MSAYQHISESVRPKYRNTEKPTRRHAETLKPGQAMVMLVLMTVILVSIATATVAMVVTNALGTMKSEQGEQALVVAEMGVEEAILNLLRDPEYTGGSLTSPSGSATVVVVGDTAKTVTSEGVVGEYVGIVEVEIEIVAGQLDILSWQEK